MLLASWMTRTTKLRRRMARPLLTLGAAALAFPVGTAQAQQTFTWTQNSATTQNWLTNANWAGNNVFSNNALNTLAFFGNTTTALAAGNNLITGNLPATLAMNALTLNGLANASSATNITIGTSDTRIFLAGPAPQVNLNGMDNGAIGLNYTVATNVAMISNTLFTGNGTATFNFTGAITGDASLTKAGTSTMILTNSNNSYTGGTFVNAGTLKLGTNSADQIPLNGNVTVASGATFNLGTASFNGSFGLSNESKPAGTITLNGGTLATEANAHYYFASGLTMTGGHVDFTQDTSSIYFRLFLTGPITVNPSNATAVWSGSPSLPRFSSISNQSGGPLTISVGAGTTASGIDLDSNLSLFGGNGSWIKSGPGVMRISYQI